MASSAVNLPDPVGIDLTHGTAQVSVLVLASVDEVWTAVTQRDVVGRWFGDLSRSLEPGGSYRLDFGDGDFFAIDDVAIEPPRHLSYQWRFLGTGPRNAIDWTIEPVDRQCRVTVTDSEASRTPQGVAEMIEGWTDFLQRLRDYCATGQNTRYAWRQEFDGSIELAVDADRAFERLTSADGQRQWLPWLGDAIAKGASLTMSDGAEPEQFTIGAVDRDGTALRFALTCPEWLAPTQVALKVTPWPGGSLLIVSHTGWQAISKRDNERAVARHRFGTLWIQALRNAQHHLGR
jgi:uncharacterized protein YndB with AHSA1/START domain